VFNQHHILREKKGAGGGQERLCVSHFRRERPFKQTHKARRERIRMGDDKNENQKKKELWGEEGQL
jgi:hypothetical protein